ncbi:hypothetical protein [Nostoc sp. NZL]|uniref:hypothetical protein n=1 Tax=Nostoc sp. NZL TaxID=2650612 RepID=UPI0018C6BB98|nr:hypothetical protein [Nostoc sp. NZL]
MKVIVDTSVWSLALRRNYKVDDLPHVVVLRELITDGRVVKDLSCPIVSGSLSKEPRLLIQPRICSFLRYFNLPIVSGSSLSFQQSQISRSLKLLRLPRRTSAY